MSFTVSIITINLNNEVGLERTIKSVVSQTYKDFEFIVIDGGSNDGSVALIEEYSSNINYWVSERDSGIYNAMNKGIRASTGTYLLFLNSGDYLRDNAVLSKCISSVHTFDFIYGDLLWYEQELSNYPKKLKFSFLSNRSLPHQATFIKKELFDRLGYYDENLKIVSDWKFFLLALCKHSCTYLKIDQVISVFAPGGISDGTASGTLDLLYNEKRECLKREFPAFLEDYEEYFRYKKILGIFDLDYLKKRILKRFAKTAVVR